MYLRTGGGAFYGPFFYFIQLLEFFLKVSDYSMKKDENLSVAMEKGFDKVVASPDWISYMDPVLESKIRNNKSISIKDILWRGETCHDCRSHSCIEINNIFCKGSGSK